MTYPPDRSISAPRRVEGIPAIGVDLPQQVDAGQSGIDAACLRGLLRRAFEERAVRPLRVRRADRAGPQSRQDVPARRVPTTPSRDSPHAGGEAPLRAQDSERGACASHVPAERKTRLPSPSAPRGAQKPSSTARRLQRPDHVPMGHRGESGMHVEVGRVLQSHGPGRHDEVARARSPAGARRTSRRG